MISREQPCTHCGAFTQWQHDQVLADERARPARAAQLAIDRVEEARSIVRHMRALRRLRRSVRLRERDRHLAGWCGEACGICRRALGNL